MSGPHISLWPVEKDDSTPGSWRDDLEDYMAVHANDMARVIQQIGYKLGNDTDGGGVANGHVRALAVPTLHVQVSAITNGDIGGTKINTARQTSIAASSIAGLTAGQRRIDVLTVDNTGTFAWTTGTASATPAAPTYPDNKIALAEVYHRKDSTKVLDVDDGTNSYITDVRPFLRYPGGGAITGSFALKGDISPSALGSDQNNWNPTGLADASVIRASASVATVNITGLAGGADGRILLIHNVGASNSLVLKDESASSTAANRFALTADVTMVPDSFVMLQYDATTARWRAVAGSGGLTVEDEGGALALQSTMNFVGSGVAVTVAGGKYVVTINAPVAASALGYAATALGSGDLTTTSGSYANATGVVTPAMTTHGQRVRVDVLLTAAFSTNGGDIVFDNVRDGTTNLSSGADTPLPNGLNSASAPAGYNRLVTLVGYDTPSAGSHTYQLVWKINPAAGTATIFADGTNDKAFITAVELPADTGGTLDNVVSKTADYTATADDQVILCTATTANVTLTLYTAVGNSGRRLIIKRTDNNPNWAAIIDGAGSETIEGAANVRLTIQNQGMTIESDGANWRIVNRFGPVPRAKITHSANQSINNSTSTNPVFDTVLGDNDGMHYSVAVTSLTGTVDKTNGSATLAGTGTLFTSELKVGQAILVPGTADEVRVVTAIASNTSLTVNANFANTSTGQTARRYSEALVIRTPGWYRCDFQLGWETNATGHRQVTGRKTTGATTTSVATLSQMAVSTAAFSTPVAISVLKELAQWDYLSVLAFQNSGGALNALAASELYPMISATLVEYTY